MIKRCHFIKPTRILSTLSPIIISKITAIKSLKNKRDFSASNFLDQLPQFKKSKINMDFRKLSQPPIKEVNTNIVLTKTEESIKSLLLDFANNFKNNDNCNNNDNNNDNKNENEDEEKTPLELRISGGWVRDKLLGLESTDIDIAINIMSGKDLVKFLLEYIEQNEIKYPKVVEKGKSFYTIAQNHERSKHLETTTAKLYGISIDFVNLRSKGYNAADETSNLKIGTPEEDALRRDATLNALFYNLNTSNIEDYTGKGINDLKNGILRTPLPPIETFRDDPLRILRLIRFASKYNFQISEDTLNAMAQPEMRDYIKSKISRERIGTEFQKILTSQNPALGLSLVEEVGLYNSVFTLSPKSLATSESIISETALRDIIQVTKKVFESSSLPTGFEIFKTDAEYKKLLWFLLALQPWGSKVPDKNIQMEFDLLKRSLPSSKHEYEFIRTAMILQPQISNLVTRADDKFERKPIARAIKTAGEKWLISIAYSAIIDILQGPSNGKDLDNILSIYKLFLEYVNGQKLGDSWKLKPLIDGKFISKTVGRKPGPWLNVTLNKVLDWQFENPDATREDCISNINLFVDEL